MADLAAYAVSWPEERTLARLERCRAMLAATGLISVKTNQQLTRRIKRLAGLRNRMVR